MKTVQIKINVLLLALMGNAIAVLVGVALWQWLGRTIGDGSNLPPEVFMAIGALLGAIVGSALTANFALASQVASDPPPPPWYKGVVEKLVEQRASTEASTEASED